MDRDKLRDKVKKDLRAMLISAPLGVPAHIFSKDYRQMNGKEIPFRELGHRNLDEFILSIPDVVRIGTGPTGLVTFYPVATKETQHIVNMIKKQKKPSIKKGVIPSAIVARKAPVKMTSFSRRGGHGARFTPRGGMGSNRHQAKYHNHPRSFSQPGSYPNLPPRFQKSHPHAATYHPPSSSSSFSSYTSLSTISRGSSKPHPATSSTLSSFQPGGSGGGGGGVRPRLSSVPENSGNRLHPQFTLANEKGKARQPISSTSPSSAPASAGAVAGGSSRASNSSSGSGSSSSLSCLWNDEFRTARHMTIEEMNTWAHKRQRVPINNPVCVEGVASRQREDSYMEKTVLKILLRSTAYRKGKMPDGLPEAVQLHFIAPFWDLVAHREPYNVPEGTRLKVYGRPFAAFIKAKDKFEPAIRVLYYERVAEGSSSSGSSSHSSPRESRSTTPKMGVDVNSSVLEDNIFKLLLKFDRGTYAKRLGKVYQNEFKTPPPDNLLERARNFPFVEIETITADNEIMHLKEEYRKRGSLQPAQPSPATIRPPLPEAVTFPDLDQLYDVLVCCVNSPFSFYVQIRDEEEGQQVTQFTKMELKMNEHFGKRPAKAAKVKESDLCACLWSDEEEEGQWCRALVISVHDSMANVLFPDYGNQDCVGVSDLFTLPPQFYQLPFQAIHCSLHGVLREEKMTGSEVDDYFADLAADKICVLQVVDCSGARASVEILDKELDDDETINSKLITKFHPIASLSPHLPAPGEPMVAVKLADVDEHGQLSIQVAGPGLSKLEELANQIEERYSDSRGGGSTDVIVGGVYCAEYRLDKSWYRVKVLKELPHRQVLVEYVDYGNEEEVDKACLRPKLDSALFSLPPQIIKCVMADIPKGPWASEAIDYLARYIQVDELNLEVVDYCIKVGGGSSLTFPVVKLHVKNSEQEMVCVNDDMLQHPSLFRSSRSESLTSHQVTSAARPTSSVSSVEQVSDHRHRAPIAHPRSQSVSSVPVFVDIAAKAEIDAFFVNKSQAWKQNNVKEPATSSGSSSQNGLDSKTELRSPSHDNSGRETVVWIDTLQVKDDSCESSSVSSLNETGSNAGSDDVEQSSPKKVLQPPAVRGTGKLEPVHSPKECIRDGVLYVVSPVAGDSPTVKSGHVAARPSDPSPSSPIVSPNHPISPSSVTPTTPPMSPPPIPLSAASADGDRSGREERQGGDGGVAGINRWAELPCGKAVEVEVTWPASPTNFTLLLLTNKSGLDSMASQLQDLVGSELCLPQQSVSAGCVCAARYSLDCLWYRAIIKQTLKNQVEVEFLDYGGGEWLPISSIKSLPEKCRELPFQAIKASLHGVSETVTLNPEMVRKFENFVAQKRLYALKVGEKDHKSSVTLVDTSTDHDIVINKEFSQ